MKLNGILKNYFSVCYLMTFAVIIRLTTTTKMTQITVTMMMMMISRKDGNCETLQLEMPNVVQSF